MFTKRFAHELAELASLDASPEVSLDRVTVLAARNVPGCAGAGAVVWAGDDPVQMAASHPDIGSLAEFQFAAREGPHWQAHRGGDPILVPDTAAGQRWPRYAGAALACGVRCSLTVPLGTGAAVVTVGLEAVRPGAFSGPEAGRLAVLLTEQVAASLGNTERYQAAAREAVQMHRALDSWGTISAAKGVIMHAHGVDEETAFDELRRASQRSQLKLAEVARRLIAEYGRQERHPRREGGRSPG